MHLKTCLKIVCAGTLAASLIFPSACVAEVKLAAVAGTFYPAEKEELSRLLETLLGTDDLIRAKALEDKKIFALISPHAGYSFSGRCAAFGYRLLKGKSYSTVVAIGPSHRFGFAGFSVYPSGSFQTPLGNVPVDADFAAALIDGMLVRFEPRAFEREHSVEVQLPFLQTALSAFKVVPVVTGNCSFEDCRELAGRLQRLIGPREDVLIVASSDLYHGYDYEEAAGTDTATLECVQRMDARGLYDGLAAGSMQMCGGYGVVTTLLLAKSLGHDTAVKLAYTTSAHETGKMVKGVWTVGYAGVAVCSGGAKGEDQMLTDAQKKRLLSIARQAIEAYLKTGRKPEISENDPLLLKEMGAFVTLHQGGQLRGCIGSLTGAQPLYLTIRNMAIESATGDPRFAPVRPADLKDIDIEISVLSPMEKVDSAEKICLGTHGVLVRKGFNSGVFLPQVATETGWTKEEFLCYLCSHKAGLPADAWKDKATDLYTFTATVFSEKEFSP